MKKFLRSTYFAIMLFFMYLPIFIMMIFSFNKGGNLTSFTGWSSQWYDSFIKNSPFIKSILTSLFVAVTSTIISLVIGVMACVGLTKLKPKRTNKLLGISNIPLINADVITAVGLMIMFIIAGAKFGIFTLIAAHISFNVPYVIVTVYPFAKKIDKNVLNAAYDLGSNKRQSFFKITLPLLMPAILTAAAIAFSMSFDDFIISYFTGGDQTNVSTFIYTAKRVQPFINAFGTILVLLIFLIIIIWNLIKFIKAKKQETIKLLKNDNYKTKVFNWKFAELNYLYLCLHNETKVRKTKSIKLLLKFWRLKQKIKKLKNKNFNYKISKLEWKKELIKQEIKNEKRILIHYDKLKIKQDYLLNAMSSVTDKNKMARMNLGSEKLSKKINKLEKQIDIINSTKEADQIKIQNFEEEINTLNLKLSSVLDNPKEVSKIKGEILKLNRIKENLKQGRNKAKLAETIEKLEFLKTQTNKQLDDCWNELKELKPIIFRQVKITEKFDAHISELQQKSGNDIDKELKILKEQRQNYLSHEKEKLSWRIIQKEEEIENLRIHVNRKKEKLIFNSENGDEPKRRTFFTRNWKNIFFVGTLLVSFASLTTAYVLNNTYDIVVGNWGSYIDPSMISEFENKYNVKVNYQQYDSNESLYNKNMSFRYDVMVPSDYMVSRFIKEDFIEEIDWSKLDSVIKNPNISDEVNYSFNIKNEPPYKINKTLVDLLKNNYPEHQPELSALKYAVPYFWGDVIMVVNTQKKSNIEWLEKNKNLNNSWELIWQAAKDGKNVLLNEDQKNIYMMSMAKSGKINADNKADIDKATDDLKILFKSKNVSLLGDQLIDSVSNGDFDIAVIYNGDLAYAANEYNDTYNKEPSIFPFTALTPKLTNTWSDNMVVSKKNRNTTLSYKFIEFIATNSKELTNFTFITSPYDGVNYWENNGIHFNDDFKKIYSPTEEGKSYKMNQILDDYMTDQFNILLTNIKI